MNDIDSIEISKLVSILLSTLKGDAGESLPSYSQVRCIPTCDMSHGLNIVGGNNGREYFTDKAFIQNFVQSQLSLIF